jgi:S1-C subfamily serine protease
MPRELRFCRNCGFRLGEGIAEYTETVRFPNTPPGTLPGNNPAGFNQYGAGPVAPYASAPAVKHKRRMSGMTWMFIGLLIFFIAAGALTAIFKPIRDNVRTGIAQQMAPRSYVGVDGFDTAENNAGVTFDNVEPPGSPADLAGLVGGDIITSFDGHEVRDDDDIDNLLETTPIGKTVDVVYIRDGETKTTKLTTVSKAEFDRLANEFRNRPSGVGRFGYEENDSERVQVPGTNIYGVRLDNISPSLPADMAGIKNGDIVIQFDDIPIRTTDEFLSRVRRAEPYSTVQIVVMRGTERLEIPVRIGRTR